MSDRQQLARIVGRIQRAEGTDDEIDALYQEFVDAVPDPEAGRFFSDPRYNGMTAEQIVNEAFKYKPITL
jgi:hypothetical protein